MDIDETVVEESTDQPAEKLDQPKEESTDQPEDDVEVADQPQEEEAEAESDEESEVVEINGETYTSDQLAELVNKGRDYTHKTQRLSAERRALEEERARLLASLPKPEPTEEDKEREEAVRLAKKYGFAMKEDINQAMYKQQLKLKQAQDFAAFQSKHNLPEKTAHLVRAWGNVKNLPYEQVYKEWVLGGEKPKKVVKRKSVGARKSASTPMTKRATGGLTRDSIAKMSIDEYKKNKDKIEMLVKKGGLK